MEFVFDRSENTMEREGHDGPGVVHPSLPDYEV